MKKLKLTRESMKRLEPEQMQSLNGGYAHPSKSIGCLATAGVATAASIGLGGGALLVGMLTYTVCQLS